MYYNSADAASEGLVLDFEGIAEVFESDYTSFGHIDVNKNDVHHILGYKPDEPTDLGSKPLIVLVAEPDTESKLPKDYNLIPYQVSRNVA